jgi:hypothetical protein
MTVFEFAVPSVLISFTNDTCPLVIGANVKMQAKQK